MPEEYRNLGRAIHDACRICVHALAWLLALGLLAAVAIVAFVK
jgi:hypothetical protein